ncbi:MAG: signal peptidase I [Candidatus Nealsonbacteria bacterium]
MKNTLLFLWEISKIVIIVLVITLPIRYFLLQPFLVDGQSMEPNFEHRDYLIVDELSYRFREPQRGEVIVFKYPNNPAVRYIKRIIGLPGETIEVQDGKVVVFNEEGGMILRESYIPDSTETTGSLKIALAKDEYFVLGDNREASSDSRRWGTVPKDNIIGQVFLRLWPITSLEKISAPVYYSE